MTKKIKKCLEIKKETKAAFLLSDDGERSVWLPKSQIKTDQDCGPGDTMVFEMPKWLAIEKGFV